MQPAKHARVTCCAGEKQEPEEQEPDGASSLHDALHRRFGPEQAEQLAGMFKALGHPVRLQMVALLSRYAGQVCVCDVESQFDLSQPTISHHLKILREAGLVASEQRGTWLYYYLRPGAAETLRTVLAEWG